MAAAEGISWTNSSVRAYSDGQDPIEKIQHHARALVLSAMEAGWSGPPFNPIELTKYLETPISLSANSDIADARTVPHAGGLEIQFNPRQPRARVRFSLAHEIAHALFPDVADMERNRGGTKTINDDWQLEMLCNLAAAEFVMPIGSLPSSGSVPSIEDLMNQRAKFDVSAEAYLIRIAKTTTDPVSIFCASPVQTSANRWQYKIDYAIQSVTCPPLKLVGLTLPEDSMVHNCTAIGYTDQAIENWIGETPLKMEYVGIPGYPGVPLPRVLGLVRMNEKSSSVSPLKYLHGNALEPRGKGPKIICQMVNDRARKWGGGIARSTAQKFPSAETEFGEWIPQIPPEARLGFVHFSSEQENEIVIASLVAQAGFGKSAFPRIRYSALELCLDEIVVKAKSIGASVHMPRIGAGGAGGEWAVIEELIEGSLVKGGVEVTVYDLPPKRAQLHLFE